MTDPAGRTTERVVDDVVQQDPSRARRVGIIGASGFTGAELLRLCAQHPAFDLVVATGDTQAGTRVADLYPSLAVAYQENVLRSAPRRGTASSIPPRSSPPNWQEGPTQCAAELSFRK